ncbi:hypothetical protein [Empedobacter sp.]|uniref:hypothetical protein n=1 Tax=Empedobacter sp. TaxID=1927715 RepID=UPI00289CE2E3|nr:hypothetical protein [Empedobacter sp.]
MNVSNKELLEILLNTNEEISNKIKRLEQLSAQIEQSNRNHLEELKKADIKVDNSGVNKSIIELERVAENTRKSIKTTQKEARFIYYSVIFCAVGLIAFFLTFKYGIDIKADIKEDYRKELSEKGQYNSPKDAEFYNKFWLWVDKNPNDSKELFKKVNKMELK